MLSLAVLNSYKDFATVLGIHITVRVQYCFNGNTTGYNLALLILKNSLILSDHVTTICLPNSGKIFENHKNCVIPHWRTHRNGSSRTTMAKQFLNILDRSECQDLLNENPQGLLRNEMCAHNPNGAELCLGVLGRSLTCSIPYYKNKHNLVGITSWSTKNETNLDCADNYKPVAFADISLQKNWIDDENKKEAFDKCFYTI